jgi:hypothetical protein
MEAVPVAAGLARGVMTMPSNANCSYGKFAELRLEGDNPAKAYVAQRAMLMT